MDPMGMAITAMLPLTVFSAMNSCARICDLECLAVYHTHRTGVCGQASDLELAVRISEIVHSYAIAARRRHELQDLLEILGVRPYVCALCEHLVIHVETVRGRHTFPITVQIQMKFDKFVGHEIFTAVDNGLARTPQAANVMMWYAVLCLDQLACFSLIVRIHRHVNPACVFGIGHCDGGYPSMSGDFFSTHGITYSSVPTSYSRTSDTFYHARHHTSWHEHANLTLTLCNSHRHVSPVQGGSCL